MGYFKMIIEQQKDYKEQNWLDIMAQTKFYFYNLMVDNKIGFQFNWKEELDKIYKETQEKKPNYQEHPDYTLSLHISEKVEGSNDITYLGYFIVTEDDTEYKKEKKGEFYELGLDEDEHLCNIPKGKLYFLLWINKKGEVILMLERQYFSLNIKGFLHYLKQRYSDKIEDIQSKNILGKDLKTTLLNLRDNEITLVRIYFKKYAPEQRVKKSGYVEDVIPKLLEKGIYADITLRWEKPPKVWEFFRKFSNTSTFEEALDIDFGEFLKIFNFETDNDTIPSMNLLDKIIFFQLPRDKSEYSEDKILKAIKEGFESKKDKLT